MPGGKVITLRQMQFGQKGRVVQIQGGVRLASRLSALGVRPGTRITKISSMIMRGPITIQSGNTQLAVGFGMANKIIVELD